MISIVSLAWNKYDLTEEFLVRLSKYTDIEHELIFTDNGSEEPISGLVKEVYPNAKLIRKDTNVGCPRTRNEAMSFVEGDIVFWLDNDTYVDAGWYKPFLEMMSKDDGLGICGPFGKVLKNPFELPFPFIEPIEPNRRCDGFMGYAMAMRPEAYKPIPDWNTPVNLDDIDCAVGIKFNGYKAKVLDVQPALKHLGSQTIRGWEVDNQAILQKWWEYWQPHSTKVFELYK